MASNLLSNFQDINFSSSSSPSSSTGKSSSSSLSHGRAIDRYSPHLRDPLREKYFSRFHSKAKPCNQKNRKNTEKSPQIISPATSSRYLLNDMPVAIDDFSDTESFPPMTSMEELRFDYLKGEALTFMESPSPPPVRQRDQVVVLKVSLHCKGCEGKVRKHISKMKGVTSFTTDLATKKVTVIGDLTPLSVLNSISKTKTSTSFGAASFGEIILYGYKCRSKVNKSVSGHPFAVYRGYVPAVYQVTWRALISLRTV